MRDERRSYSQLLMCSPTLCVRAANMLADFVLPGQITQLEVETEDP
jgi:hypothetical protein